MSTELGSKNTNASHEPDLDPAHHPSPSAANPTPDAVLTAEDLDLLRTALPAVERLYARLNALNLTLRLRQRTRGESLADEDVLRFRKMIDAGFTPKEIASELNITAAAVHHQRKKYAAAKLAAVTGEL